MKILIEISGESETHPNRYSHGEYTYACLEYNETLHYGFNPTGEFTWIVSDSNSVTGVLFLDAPWLLTDDNSRVLAYLNQELNTKFIKMLPFDYELKALIADFNNDFYFLNKAQDAEPIENTHLHAPFIEAVCAGKLDVVIAYVEQGVDPSCAWNAAIMEASSRGWTDLVSYLLSNRRVDPNANNGYALQTAATNNHFQVVERLLAHPDINPAINHGFALRAACRHGHVSIVSLLLNDTRIDLKDYFYEVLQNATKDGHTNIVQLLLSKKKILREELNPPLKAAAKYGHVDLFKLLFSYVDRDLNFLQFYDIILVACENGSVRIIEFLLMQEPIRTDYEKRKPRVPIETAATKGHFDAVKLLLANPATHPGESLDLACAAGHTHVIRLLLRDKRVNPALIKNNSVKSAMQKGYCATIALLVEDPRMNFVQECFLYNAIDNEQLEIVKLLIKKYNPTIQGHLMIRAIQLGSLDIVKVLFQNTKVADSANKWAVSAIASAFSYQRGSYREVIRFLLYQESVSALEANIIEGLARDTDKNSLKQMYYRKRRLQNSILFRMGFFFDKTSALNVLPQEIMDEITHKDVAFIVQEEALLAAEVGNQR